MESKSELHKQLEQIRFERALEVSESLASHRALLTTAELARLNNILTGKTEDPWRQEATTVTLPSGKKENLSLLTNPKLIAREKLHRATALAESGSVIEASVDIYVGLVLSHLFRDANRRTAVIAADYFLTRYGLHISGAALHALAAGDLREEEQVNELKKKIFQLAKQTSRQ
ncbi:MAG: hypothetical protein A3K03_01845 [Bdellovibrionales bacterium RIFOXYD1_FULL_44_7]|nr:MAG: hypothetical protein A3K03_01845 [Bdellovibrionales bacterium RIFOXYD1_FULL_44_7]